MTQTPLSSPRRAFIFIMTCLAVPFGTAAAAWRLNGQLDLTADLLKIAIFVAITVALAAYLSWRFIVGARLTRLRGALAGLTTAVLTIPAPFAISGFKREFLKSFREDGQGALASVLDGGLAAIHSGLYQIEDMTKMSLLAVLSSMGVGFMVVSYFQQKQAETPHAPQ